MRMLAEAIAATWVENQAAPPQRAKAAALRARLATSINPKDDEHDAKILSHFDDLFSGKGKDIELFSRRLALLLKHDWERVKWESTPLYFKPFIRYTKKQRVWRDSKMPQRLASLRRMVWRNGEGEILGNCGRRSYSSVPGL